MPEDRRRRRPGRRPPRRLDRRLGGLAVDVATGACRTGGGRRGRSRCAWRQANATLRVDVETVVADEADERQPARRAAWTASAVGPSQRRACRTRRPRLLHHLRRPPADEQAGVRCRGSPASSMRADHLVDGVVRGRRPRGVSDRAVGDRTPPRRGRRRSRRTGPAAERPLPARGEHVGGDRLGRRQRGQALEQSSIWSLPHHPQLDDVGPSRGVGAGASPPVSTVTTLNSVSAAGAVGAVADARDRHAGRAAPR